MATLPSGAIVRMRLLLPASATKTLPWLSRATPKGSSKRLLAAGPSTAPGMPSPASVVTRAGQNGTVFAALGVNTASAPGLRSMVPVK